MVTLVNKGTLCGYLGGVIRIIFLRGEKIGFRLMRWEELLQCFSFFFVLLTGGGVVICDH